MTDQPSKRVQFSIETMNDILSETKSIKKKLNSYVAQFQQYDMTLIYQTLNYLHVCMVTPKFNLKQKFNSLFVLKVLFDTSNFVLVNWIEVYFLPHILEIAKFNINGQNNGKDYFLKLGYSVSDDPQVQKFGFNYTLLASEIIQVAALVKPKRLFQSEFIQSKSDFVLALEDLKKAGFKQPQKLSIYAKPQVIAGQVANYKQNMDQVSQNTETFLDMYGEFTNAKVEEYLFKSHGDQTQMYQINIVQLCQSGDLYVSSSSIQICKAQIKQPRTPTSLQNALNIFHRLILSADYEAFYSLNYQDTLKKVVMEVLECDKTDRGLKRGDKFYAKFKSPKESQKLYILFLDFIQKWAFFGDNFGKDEQNVIKKVVQGLSQKVIIQLPQASNLEGQKNRFKLSVEKNKQRTNRLSQQIQMIPSILKQVLPKFEQFISKEISSSQIKQSTKKEAIVTSSKLQSDTPKNIKSTPLPPMQNSKKQLPFVKQMNQAQQILGRFFDDRQNQDKNKAILQKFVANMDAQLNTVPEEVFDQVFEKAIGLQTDIQQTLKKAEAQKSLKKESQVKSSVKQQTSNVQTKHIEQSIKIQTKKVQSQTIFQHAPVFSQKSFPRQQTFKSSNKQHNQMEDTPVKRFNLQESERNFDPHSHEQLGYNGKVKSQSFRQIQPQTNKRPSQLGYQEPNKTQGSNKHLPVSQNSNTPYGYEHKVIQENQLPATLGYQKSIQRVEVQRQSSFEYQQKPQQPQIQNPCNKFIRKTQDLSQSRKKLEESSIKSNSKVENFSPESSKFSQHQNKEYEQSNFKKKEYQLSDQLQIPLEQIEGKVYINRPKQFKSLSSQNRQVRNPISSQQYSPQRVERVFSQQQLPLHSHSPNQPQNIVISHPSEPVLGFQAQQSHTPVPFSPKSVSDYEMQKQRYEAQRDHLLEQEQQLIHEQDQIDPPRFSPLEQSFHDFGQLEQKIKSNIHSNNHQELSFKNCFENDKYILQSQDDKKTKMYWLENETTNLVKNILMKKEKSRVSKINVPQLLDERNKKYQQEIKMVEEEKNKKIQELQKKVKNLEKESDFYKDQVNLHVEQLKTLKAQSQYDKQSVGQRGYLQDMENIAAQKFQSPTRFGYSNLKNLQFDPNNFKETAYLDPKGKLINSKTYKQYFQQFRKQKEKKTLLKTKDLLHKDNDIEIGFMSKKENNKLIIIIYVTPERDIQEFKWKVNCKDALTVDYESNSFLSYIRGKKQEKIVFTITVNRPCFALPEVEFGYIVSGENRALWILLPCPFHKFFLIKECDIDMNEYFKKNDNVVRGQEVPYSKRVLKNLDNLKEYFQSMNVLNKGQPNEQGEIGYGGMAIYKNYQFPVRICVKPNQFLYVQAATSLSDKKDNDESSIIEFYICTVTHLLMKEID